MDIVRYCPDIKAQDFEDGNVFIEVNDSGSLHQVTRVEDLPQGMRQGFVLHISVEKKES